jgi:hypothetical protein
MEIGLALLGASLALALATALADAEGVTLAWDASADHAHVSHYRVHYGVASRTYLFSTNAGLALTQRVEVPWPAEWFFAVSAVGTNGLESDFSNEVMWRAPLGAPWLQGEAYVRLQPMIERSTNLVEWSAAFAGSPTYVHATNGIEFFRNTGLTIEAVNVTGGEP